ncbi:MAG: HAD family hydrolase [Desulfobulbaceae bacterium]|nr:HAD family hydrolase [Desulfobulbaceae bacterium]
MMNIKAVIFDLDGTLLNTLEDIAASANRVLEGAGLPAHPVDRYRYFVGEGMRCLIERIVPENERSNDLINDLIRAFIRDYGNNWKVKTSLYDGIATLLDGLQNRGIKLSVFSNKPHDFTIICVREFLSRWTFRAIIGQREGKPRKPDPDGALEIARLLDVDPGMVLYLGDTATDMKTARAAGMIPAGALWGFRTEKELWENGALHVFRQPPEVLDLIP